MIKRPAMSNAERQRAFRLRHFKRLEADEARLEVAVSADCARTLKRIALHRDASKRETLEALVHAWDRMITKDMSSAERLIYHRETAKR